MSLPRDTACDAAATDSLALELIDGEARLWPAAFAHGAATRLFEQLRAEVRWQQEDILIFGERRRVPRLMAWHGDPGAAYRYSGTDHVPQPWLPVLQAIRARVEALTGSGYNAVLLNLYRDGGDGMGWHADDEPELGRNPVIASVSLGAARRFCLRHRRRTALRLELSLPHGSVLCMAGTTQHHWMHALPKTKRPVGPRINLTFRLVAVT